MPLFKTVDPIPLTYVRTRNGALVTGLTATVKVTNAVTGATLLATTSLVEIATGVYSYNWTHTLTGFTQCVVQYTVGGYAYIEHMTVDEALSVEQSYSGRAT